MNPRTVPTEQQALEQQALDMADKIGEALFSPLTRPRPVRPVPAKIAPTPGPWIHKQNGDIVSSVDGSEYVIAWTDADACLSEEEQFANGRILAQAPALAAIARDLVAAWDKCDTTGLASLILRAKLALSLAEVR